MTGPDSEGLQAAHERDIEPAIVRAVHRVIDCRSSVGETMGMIDAAIHCLRVASRGDVSDPVVVEALRDLVADPEVRTLLASLPSPVVPLVGAVPVEVPEDIAGSLWPVLRSSITGGDSIEKITERVVAEVAPLIAARVQAELEAEDECPRTTCQQIAATASDVYCEVTGGQLSYPTYDARTILSHANDQTQKLIDDECARERAEERQRIDGLIAARLATPVGTKEYGNDALIALRAEIAAGSAVPVATPQRPEIVVLCGSTRFKDAFREAAKSEALAGRIVLTVSDLDPRPEMRNVNVPIDADTKARLDQLHRHKIDLADRVLVLNVGGYIGESTRSEIEYATAHGKPISYLEDVS